MCLCVIIRNVPSMPMWSVDCWVELGKEMIGGVVKEQEQKRRKKE